jgi:hypothetical protein
LSLALASTVKLGSKSHRTQYHIVAYLLKARTVEAEKQPLLGNAPTQQ